jgi:hypothetical protein
MPCMVGKAQLSTLLGCSVVQYVMVDSQYYQAFKVKNSEPDLRVALTTGKNSGCFVF